jgi:protein-S-isoprenylcysteine O-methyltransferase Ste14
MKNGNLLRSWNIAIGNFFFQYRNFLYPFLFLFVAATMRPTIILGSIFLDRLLVGCGAAVAIAGEIVRLVTIGYEGIRRGGKKRQVYANRLASGGMYGVVRNPLYLGNALIVVGMTMFLGVPLAYFVVIPFFLFVYQAIVSAEEEYLRNRFKSEYDEYCASVKRFIPSLAAVRRSFSGLRFDWKRSFTRDMGTAVGLTMGLILVPVWRTYFLEGWAAAKAVGVKSFALACAGGLLYAFLLYLKKRKLFIFRSNVA